ncbi:GNAT family N-acetyltransferase [Cytobacillus massiliigabonensis]|uniref:GNAT family N-acetyltransferase n=1 Tax=Cytobacillus massiliigabonensis TaxID=1871011 RepID=UPI000C833886|nr:GNAT family N-acetyltransferase [Cytobacillus massiliigabonensis]
MPNNLVSLDSVYEVSIAMSKDADKILDLLKDVAKWLKEKGIDQWGFLAAGGEDDEVRQAINNNNTYIVKRDGVIVATFTLYPTQSSWDKYTWGNLNDGAVYLHRLAISRTKIGSGLGKKILQWMETILEKEGKNSLRLDCVGNNSKLNEFYRNYGFEKVGNADGHSLFQKNI